MAKEKVVVNGAILTCTQAQVPNLGGLIVLPVRKCKAENQPAGIISDSIPIINIGSMGTCLIISGGNPGPCVPATPGNWTPGSLKCKCESIALLKKGDTLTCTVGGSISVNNAGQTKVDAE